MRVVAISVLRVIAKSVLRIIAVVPRTTGLPVVKFIISTISVSILRIVSVSEIVLLAVLIVSVVVVLVRVVSLSIIILRVSVLIILISVIVLISISRVISISEGSVVILRAARFAAVPALLVIESVVERGLASKILVHFFSQFSECVTISCGVTSCLVKFAKYICVLVSGFCELNSSCFWCLC